MQYYILPTDQDIQHKSHKYIERVKTSSGKWRYIYKKPKIWDQVNRGLGIKQRKEWAKSQGQTERAQRNVDERLSINEEHRKNRLKATKYGLMSAKNNEESQKHDMNALTYEMDKLKQAKSIESEEYRRYYHTPLGKAEHALKAGMEFLEIFFSKKK